MYLTSATLDKGNIIKSWKGRKGKFVRTFGFNTKRNNNEWRVTWESIKQHIGTAIGRPGIEYEKCVDNKCDLDHVEADSFEENIEKQKPFERTTIIDYIFDEDNETVDLIHEVHDDAFFERIKNGEIQYVSAMVWPATGGYDVLGTGRAGLPIIDAYHWKYVHHAFLTSNPAYGIDIAKVKTTCEGEDCQIQLLTSKQLFAETTTAAPGGDLDPLKEIPLLYKHKDELHFITASKKVQELIKKKKDSGIEINDKELVATFNECGESNKLDSSFKSCTCSKIKMDETEKKELESKLKSMEEKEKDLQSKLKAAEDKEKQTSDGRTAKYSKLFSQSENEDDAKKMYSKLKSSTDDPEELKAMEEEFKKHETTAKKSADDPKVKELESRLKAREDKDAVPMVAALVAVRKPNMPDSELVEFESSLKSKTFAEIETQYNNELYVINNLQSKEVVPGEKPHFEFNGNQNQKLSLSSKSLEEISEEST